MTHFKFPQIPTLTQPIFLFQIALHHPLSNGSIHFLISFFISIFSKYLKKLQNFNDYYYYFSFFRGIGLIFLGRIGFGRRGGVWWVGCGLLLFLLGACFRFGLLYCVGLLLVWNSIFFQFFLFFPCLLPILLIQSIFSPYVIYKFLFPIYNWMGICYLLLLDL